MSVERDLVAWARLFFRPMRRGALPIAMLTAVLPASACRSRGDSGHAATYAAYSAALDAVVDSLPGVFRQPLLIVDTTGVAIPNPYDARTSEELRRRIPNLDSGVVSRAASLWNTGGNLVDSFTTSAPHVLLSSEVEAQLKEAGAERPALIVREFGPDATVVCLAPVAVVGDQALVLVSSGCGMQGPSFTAVTVALKRERGRWQSVYVSPTQVN